MTHLEHIRRTFKSCQPGDFIELRLSPEGTMSGIMLGSKLDASTFMFQILRHDGNPTSVNLFRRKDDVSVISRLDDCITP